MNLLLIVLAQALVPYPPSSQSGSGLSSTYVTLGTAQTVTGAKTFGERAVFDGGVYLGTNNFLKGTIYSSGTSNSIAMTDDTTITIGRGSSGPNASWNAAGSGLFQAYYGNGGSNLLAIGSASFDITADAGIAVSGGSATFPGIWWREDRDATNTGIYRPGANEIGLTVNGVRAFRFAGSPTVMYGSDNNTSLRLDSSVGASLISTAGSMTIDSANISFSGVSPRSALGFKFNYSGGGSKPTCDSTHRGEVWFVQSGAGVSDTFELCAKSAADTYAWTAVATPIP